jgi:HemY protein
MKWKIGLVLALIIGGIGGSWLKNLPGFVIIAYDKTSYEMRLWIAVSLLLIFLAVLYFIGRIIRSFISGTNRVKLWQGDRHWRKARKQTIKGMLSFMEGRWQQAEKTMINAAKNSDTKLINYLVAAQSAQHQHSEERRDAYLRVAHKAEPNAKVAIGLTQAQLQLDNLQFEQALATLTDLRTSNNNHPFILKLLSATYRKLQDWQSLIELLPSLKKQGIFREEKLEKIESEAVFGVLNWVAEKGELENFKDTWSKLPSSSRKKPAHITAYAKHLIEFDQMDEADKTLRPLFKKSATDELIELYGKLSGGDASKRFSFLENWYNNNPQASNAIYLTLGKVAYDMSLWGKARFYLERGLRIAPNAESFFMMAKTLQKLDDIELASECYRQGLEFVIEPKQPTKTLLLEQGADELVSANILPKFENN